MEQFNEETIRNIWKRVQSQNTQALSEPEKLAEREQLLRQSLLRLSSRYAGYRQQILRRMAAQCGQTANVLRGMCVLGAGKSPEKPEPVRTDALLRRCYGEMLALLRAYEQHVSDPQFGPVFSSLARQKQSQCHQLLALAGKQ